MVRRGSTVRVRQRALQKRRKPAPSRSDRLAPRRTCSGYGAVYGAFAFRTPAAGAENAAWGRRRARGSWAAGRNSVAVQALLRAARDDEPPTTHHARGGLTSPARA